MKRRSKIFLKIESPILLLLGFTSSFIQWGHPTQFHGKGFPIPTVMWDHAHKYYDHPPYSETEFIPFSSPLGFILNPLIFLFTSLIIYLTAELTIKLARRLTR